MLLLSVSLAHTTSLGTALSQETHRKIMCINFGDVDRIRIKWDGGGKPRREGQLFRRIYLRLREAIRGSEQMIDIA
jgi:hypothetical protein